jgi:hypothetical protein
MDDNKRGHVATRPSISGEWFFALAVLVAIGVMVYFLFPASITGSHWRPMALAGGFGILVGATDICFRYRDEPLTAALSPFGVCYALINGGLSLGAIALLYKYPKTFGDFSMDGLQAAVVAGFGAMVIMRSKFAVVKGGDNNQEIAVGPDFVITGILKVVDQRVDRMRAASRQTTVVKLLPCMRAFATFDLAANYMLAALFAFQNLDPDRKKDLTETIASYRGLDLPVDIKYLAIGFLFLTVVGERHYGTVMENAKALQDTQAQGPTAEGNAAQGTAAQGSTAQAGG